MFTSFYVSLFALLLNISFVLSLNGWGATYITPLKFLCVFPGPQKATEFSVFGMNSELEVPHGLIEKLNANDGGFLLVFLERDADVKPNGRDFSYMADLSSISGLNGCIVRSTIEKKRNWLTGSLSTVVKDPRTTYRMKSVARMVKKLVRSVQRFLDPSKLFAIGDTHGSAMAIHFARAMGRQVAILIVIDPSNAPLTTKNKEKRIGLHQVHPQDAIEVQQISSTGAFNGIGLYNIHTKINAQELTELHADSMKAGKHFEPAMPIIQAVLAQKIALIAAKVVDEAGPTSVPEAFVNVMLKRYGPPTKRGSLFQAWDGVLSIASPRPDEVLVGPYHARVDSADANPQSSEIKKKPGHFEVNIEAEFKDILANMDTAYGIE